MKTEHYFSEKHTLEDDFKEFDFIFNDKKFSFTTNSGVFSRKYIDFGSQNLLEELNSLDLHGKILEVGCGYGAITIPLAYFKKDCQFDMVDINEEAISLSEKNILRNKITNINVFKSNIYESVKSFDYDCIFSNPPIRAGKKVTYQIYEKAFDHLKNGGLFVIVIQKKQGAESSIKKLNEIFGNCDILAKKKGYFILASKKNIF